MTLGRLQLPTSSLLPKQLCFLCYFFILVVSADRYLDRLHWDIYAGSFFLLITLYDTVSSARMYPRFEKESICQLMHFTGCLFRHDPEEGTSNPQAPQLVIDE